MPALKLVEKMMFLQRIRYFLEAGESHTVRVRLERHTDSSGDAAGFSLFTLVYFLSFVLWTHL